jgi:hypothetical protein
LNGFLKMNFPVPNVLNAFGKFFCCPRIGFLIIALGFSASGFAEDDFHAGPLYDQFPLTLDSGQRTEVVGPLFYEQQKDSEKTWAFPPFFSHTTDPDVEYREDDFLYPLLNYEIYGKEYRWQFFELWSFAGGNTQQESRQKRFTIFPFYFQQRSPVPDENYTALLPIYGHLQHRLFRDKIFFVMFPIYSETQKKDIVSDNYLWPFFQVRHGDGMSGWQFWPVVGNEHKDVTSQTNGFGDVSIVAGHKDFFALWPFIYVGTTGIGTDNPEKSWGVLPLYLQSRSPKRDSTSVIWPFFSWIEDRGKKYNEWQGPWPFVIFARGEGKTTDRVFPLFSLSHNNELESDSYLWPVFQFKRTHSDPLDMRRTRILYYLYDDMVEKNTATGANKRRLDMWPFLTYHRDFNGKNRLQILALVEPALPDNSRIERNWSPLWSIWVSENNPKSGASSQSFLWNLYRHESTPTSKKCSLLFGLFQYQSDTDMKRLRLFYIPVFKTHPKTGKLAEL